MSTNDYAGKGTLPPEQEQRVQSELTAGERLVWVGRARPDLYRGQTIFMAIFGAFFGGAALFILVIGLAVTVGFTGFGAAQGNGWGGLVGCFPLFFCLFTVPFLLIGGYMLTAPIWMPKRIRRILYALSDRRALVWEPGWSRDRYTVRSYTREGLGRMVRVDRAGGAGDLVFEEYYTTSTNSDGMSSTSRNQRGFMGIDRVRELEELVRLTLMP
jgi:hypothetical protein